jgi:hypothetical protein
MEKENRPAGRKKFFGSGSGSAAKRGEGLGAATGGPVGESTGYADRTEDSSADQARSSEGGGGGGRGIPGGGGLFPGGKSPKLIVILIVIVLAVYLIYKVLSGGTGDLLNLGGSGSPGYHSAASSSALTYVDKGAYPVVTSVSKAARAKRTFLQGNGRDKATIMIYMCGTDLESRNGMATADLNEMLQAEIPDKVNIIVETGGAAKWQNNIISNRTNQRYKVTSQGLLPLEKNLGSKSMVDPATLADFINYTQSNYPADRYLLVLWDHGGGSLSGYGYDEKYPQNSMTLDEIGLALKNGGCTFDLIGFDACLMGTLETALVLEPYADYMIASEEVEPGIGWYYTGWLSALARNTSLPTTELGKKLIDDYVSESQAKTPDSQTTLSLLDLAELKGTVPAAFGEFAQSTTRLIDEEKYQVVSDARSGSKEFAASSRLNQIDLIHFAENLGNETAKSFANVLRGCVKYNRTSSNISNANGISVFFPYGRLSQLNTMLDTYDQIGVGDEYSRCIRSFASVTAGGQVVAGGSNNLLETLLGSLAGGSQQASGSESSGAEAVAALLNSFLAGGDYSSLTGKSGESPDWLDTERMQSSLQYYQDKRFDASALALTEKKGQRVLALTEKQWDLIQEMEMNVFLDDGEGFIDLGLDNVYDYNEDGDLLMEYDGTWLALNGRIVSYYLLTDDRYGETYAIRGRVPALLNGQLVDIILAFDDQNPQGTVLGAQIKYDTETQTATVPRGLLPLAAGDKIDYLCDYYSYDGKYNDTYYLGEQYTATGEWTIENLSVDNMKYQMTYRLTDIYDNHYWTPSVSN